MCVYFDCVISNCFFFLSFPFETVREWVCVCVYILVVVGFFCLARDWAAQQIKMAAADAKKSVWSAHLLDYTGERERERLDYNNNNNNTHTFNTQLFLRKWLSRNSLFFPLSFSSHRFFFFPSLLFHAFLYIYLLYCARVTSWLHGSLSFGRSNLLLPLPCRALLAHFVFSFESTVSRFFFCLFFVVVNYIN